MALLFVSVVVVVFLAVETRRAWLNEAAQRARGGIEPEGDVYALMSVAYPAAFALMIAEGAWRGTPEPSTVVAGWLLFVAAKALKWWAIVTLNRAWTFRVIVVPGSRLVSSGPYMFFRHPNYLAVMGELVGVALMTGSRVAGPIATIAFGLLIVRRMAVENRALDAILRRR